MLLCSKSWQDKTAAIPCFKTDSGAKECLVLYLAYNNAEVDGLLLAENTVYLLGITNKLDKP